MLIAGMETATRGEPEDKMLLEREWKRRTPLEKEKGMEKEKEKKKGKGKGKRMEKELEWTL